MKRKATKDGSFCSLIVIPDPENPGESIAIRNVRGSAVGGGFGAFGGFIEPGDNGDYRPKRELIEELTELAQTDKQRAFIGKLAESIVFQPMFTVRDDQHNLDRGWGFMVDSHAHIGVIPEDMRQEALEIFSQLGRQQSAGHEVKTALITKVKDMGAMLPNYHYKHEGLGDLVATQIVVENAQIAANKAVTYDAWAEIEASNPKALDTIAAKMHLRREDIKFLYDRMLFDSRVGRFADPGKAPAFNIPSALYRAAYASNTGLSVPVHYEQLDFSPEKTTLVRSSAPKFILPVPVILKDGAPIELIIPNRNESTAKLPTDGTKVITVNDPTPQQSEKMQAVINHMGGSPEEFTVEQIHAWLACVMSDGPLPDDVARLTGQTNGLGIKDVFDQRLSSVKGKLENGAIKSSLSAAEFAKKGGACHQLSEPMPAVYVTGSAKFFGTAQAIGGKQSHEGGMLVVREDTKGEIKYRSIDVGEGIAERTYILADGSPLNLNANAANVKSIPAIELYEKVPERIVQAHQSIMREVNDLVRTQPGTRTSSHVLKGHQRTQIGRGTPASHYLNDTQYDAVVAIVKEAGDYAKNEQSKVVQETSSGASADRKPDQSPVTRIDIHNSTIMMEALRKATPYKVLSEEDPHPELELQKAQREGRPVWVIDPLDGTLSYTEGHPEYAVSAALLVPNAKGEMEPAAGFVYLPGENKFLHSGKAGYASVENTQTGEVSMLKPRKTYDTKSPLDIAIGWRKGDDTVQGPLATFADHSSTKQYTLPLRMAKTLMGESHVGVLGGEGGIKIWDTAPMHAIAKAAGADFVSYDPVTRKMQDAPLQYGGAAAHYHNGKILENPPFICATAEMMTSLGLASEPAKVSATRR